MGESVVKKVLLIAYHFPPIRHSSGIQRTLKFARYLRDHGWQPLVLTVHPRAYPLTGDDLLGDIPEGVPVRRAFALDTARHLALRGRYPGFMAIPDRYASWLIGGIWSGMSMIRQYRPEAIWSTYPIATAHRIGWWLRRLSGLPWVADFRDMMIEADYPSDPRTRRAFEKIERMTVTDCDRAVFTTPGTLRLYAERYPQLPERRWALIPNGYDEENFADAEQLAAGGAALGKPGQRVLVHAGILYPEERDPRPFFEALSRLKHSGDIDHERLKIVLRATGHDAHYAPMLAAANIGDIVELAPPVSYREALAEMLRADGLLLFQASNCNNQIPAKLYEYLRAQRPILALTDPKGDTAAALRETGTGEIVRLDRAEDIAAGLRRFVGALEAGKAALPSAERVRSYDRAAAAAKLAQLLEDVTAERGS
jgi:glycosyltransferase involved in cell wall biosynthesis